ncbi:uncharacterized protein LODBEIA_P38030 [Lodderomyces beijingensis]|uniref:Pre-mRNA-splicing factor CWC22 n=1 Tax=Lodderomyces beijingensis TaxID=1775926 RepID=A0ABP0ZN64_9ASCO
MNQEPLLLANDDQDQIKNISCDVEAQKKSWMALKRSIKALVRDINQSNIRNTVAQLLALNIKRGRGLVAREIIRCQLSDPATKVPLYASLVAVLNSKVPQLGKLLCNRLLLQFNKSYLANNWKRCRLSLLFICHLTLQNVVSEILLLQLIQLFLDRPTNGGIELTVEISKVCGALLMSSSAAATNMILGRLKDILQDDPSVSGNSKGSIKHVLGLARAGFRSPRKTDEASDLISVDAKDQEKHDIVLGEPLKSRDYLNVFRFDPNFEDSEKDYQTNVKHLIIEAQEEKKGDEEGDGEKEEEEISQEKGLAAPVQPQVQEKVTDMTQSHLLDLQKQVYLTVMSSMSADEAVHKLLKLQFRDKRAKQDHARTLADMIIRCCSQEKTYSKFFGIIGEKLCARSEDWHQQFVGLFKSYYESIDSFETKSLRNIGKFFGHLFASDVVALDQAWDEIRITEQDTTPAKRILLKFIFQEMVEALGVASVKKRLLYDEHVKRHITGVFPVVGVDWNDADDIRFSINFFTAIGLGILTEEMRDVLKNLPEPELRGRTRDRSSSRSSYTSGSSYSRSRSSSRSRSFSRSRSASQNSKRS